MTSETMLTAAEQADQDLKDEVEQVCLDLRYGVDDPNLVEEDVDIILKLAVMAGVLNEEELDEMYDRIL